MNFMAGVVKVYGQFMKKLYRLLNILGNGVPDLHLINPGFL